MSMREEFEAAYIESLVERCGEGFRETALYSLSEKKPNGDYQHYIDFIAWWAWQASREALVIELPSPAVAGSSCIREHAIRDCLEAAGLKVNP